MTEEKEQQGLSELDELIITINKALMRAAIYPRKSREMSFVVAKLQEASMWCEQVVKVERGAKIDGG
jgi:hypothetical protein